MCIAVQPMNNAVIVSGEIVQELSCTYTCIHSPPNPPPMQAGTEHRAEFHALDDMSLLLMQIKYSHVNMTFPRSLIAFPPGNPKFWLQVLSDFIWKCLCASFFQRAFSLGIEFWVGNSFLFLEGVVQLTSDFYDLVEKAVVRLPLWKERVSPTTHSSIFVFSLNVLKLWRKTHNIEFTICKRSVKWN